MKQIFKLFKGGESKPPATSQTKNRPTSKLNQQLSEKLRRPSAVPGSFLARDQQFKKDTSVKNPNAVVPPLNEAPVEYKQGGKFASWAPAYAKIEGSLLYLYPPSNAPENGCILNKENFIKKIQLVGWHLTASSKCLEEFTISERENGAGSAVSIKARTARERDGWMVALGKVPGLFRRVEDYYILGRKWGHGATSEVTECTGKFTGRKLALKRRLHSTREASKAMHNELRILQICAKYPHPAIPELEDFFFDTSGRIELIMQLMEGGELFDWIAERDHLTEDDARAVFRQIVSGVAHLHARGIAHRDLKPQNLMYVAAGDEVSEGTIKIMDYDLSRVNYSPEWEGSTPCGTVHYMAPEVVGRQKYSLAIDCWSLGVILYILLSGCMPFVGKEDKDVEAAIGKGQYALEGEVWENVSDEAKYLIKGLLRLDPTERLTAEQCLQHPWLAEISSEHHIGRSTSRQRLSRAASPDRGLRTVQKLRELSGSLPGSRSGGFARDGSIQGSSPTIPASPISKALDYDLTPIRRQASSFASLKGDSPPRNGGIESSVDSDGINRLRITLDLVGTEAGIVDSRAAEAAGRGDMNQVFVPSSPAITSPIGLAAAKPKESDDFADLDAKAVEELEEIDDGELEEVWEN